MVLAVALPALPPADRGSAEGEEAFLPLRSLVMLADRPVCSLLDFQTNETHVWGQDGSSSVIADGTAYWTFNDTVVESPGGDRAIIPNNIGWTADFDAADCVSLTHATTGGYARATLPRLEEEYGAFTSGAVAVEPGLVHFYYASAINDPVDGYTIRGFGLGRFDTATLTGERLLGGELLWSEEQFAGAHADEALALIHDGYVHPLLRLTFPDGTAGTLLARVPVALIASPAAYEYWNGATWQPDIPDLTAQETADAALLWRQPVGMNAPSIAYNAFLDKWLAVYTSGFAHIVEARVADDITGPWDKEAPSLAVDCLDFHPPPQPGFVCYLAQQHPAYEQDGGRRIYVTFTNQGVYQVFLHELRLGAPVTQWTDEQGRAAYAAGGAAPEGFFSDDGVVFYASDIPVPGFSAIHRWDNAGSGEIRYGAAAPEGDYADAGVAFYAPLAEAAADAANASYAPVYRWSKGDRVRYSAVNLSPAGYAAEEVAFYGACPDGDGDGLSDCAETYLGADPDLTDTDGDGLADGYEVENESCDPALFTDDLDGLPTTAELFYGTTDPCLWDSGRWGCDNAPLRHPGCDVDSDNDRCMDAWELGPEPGLGGQRDPVNRWDYFNPTGDGMNRTDDIMLVIFHYFAAAGEVGYSEAFDRGGVVGHPWELGPPNGRITVDDILGAVNSYMHDCRD